MARLRVAIVAESLVCLHQAVHPARLWIAVDIDVLAVCSITGRSEVLLNPPLEALLEVAVVEEVT